MENHQMLGFSKFPTEIPSRGEIARLRGDRRRGLRQIHRGLLAAHGHAAWRIWLIMAGFYRKYQKNQP
jgi:hypothetical protein